MNRILQPALLVSVLFLALWGLSSAASAQPDPHPPRREHEPIAADGTLRRIRVPILMYHYISELPAGADDIRRGLTVSPAAFRGQLEYLVQSGYQTISLYDLYAALVAGALLPPQPVILTFDDGHLDHYTHVFPTLRQYGQTATFFIITALADRSHPAHLNWQQIAEMAAAGMNMESHTKDHADLRGRDHDFLVYQLLGSLESLAAYTGRPAHMLAYPIGHYDEMTLQVTARLPIWMAVTTQPGDRHTTDARLELPRLRVPGGAGSGALAALLRGG